MSPDKALAELQKIVWDGLTVQEARQEAIVFMGSWDWQEKVPEYAIKVQHMDSVRGIATFMWNATMKGLEIKQKKTLAEIED